MVILAALSAAFASAVVSQQSLTPDEFRSQMRAASAAVRGSLTVAGDLLLEGKPDEATQKILGTFPEATRTPVESLVLGNVLFKQEREVSYNLHKRAAETLTDMLDVQFEWALQLHRAGEFGHAIEPYRRYLKAHPNRAPVWGVLAECVLRTGDTKEACETWIKSERATDGSLEDVETLICELHEEPPMEHRRGELLRGVEKGDVESAEKLIALDAAWEFDWWNRRAHKANLKHDAEAVRRSPIEPSRRFDAVLCAAECALAMADEEADNHGIKDILRKYDFLTDREATIPGHGGLASTVLSAALDDGVLSIEEARDRLGGSALEKARATSDPEMFNVAARLYLDTERLPAIDEAGWNATGDPRFAASYLASMLEKHELRLDSPQLVKAIAAFPEDAVIARLACSCAVAEEKPLEPYLIALIKAEYHHLSHGGMLGLRPSINNLRAAFIRLAKLQGVYKPQPGEEDEQEPQPK